LSSTEAAPASLLAGWRRASAPKSVAIVGASDDNYYVRSVVENLGRAKFGGDLIGIHPRRTEALGMSCVPALADAGQVDLTFVAVRRDQVLPAVEEAVRLRTGGVVVIAEGFRDGGDPEWAAVEDTMAQLVRSEGVPLVGPNTLGFVNPGSGSLFFSVPVKFDVEAGNVALLVQSGGLLSGLVTYLHTLHTGVAQGIAIGNARCVTAADWLRLMVADDDVRVVGLVIESVGEWAAFEAALDEAAARGVVVVVCINGKTAEGMAVAASHTGAMATEYAVLAGLLRRRHAILSDDVNELAVTVAMCSRFGTPSAAGAGIFGQSGGGNAQMADLCSRAGVALPAPSPETVTAVQQGRYTVSGNPIDVATIAMSDPAAFQAAAGAFFSDPAYGVGLYNVSLDPDPFRRGFLQRVQAAARAASCPVVATPVTFTPADVELLRQFSEDPWVLTVPVADHAAGAVRNWLSLALPTAPQAQPEAARWTPTPEQWRHEADVKALLRERGASVPESRWLATPDDSPDGLGAERVAVKGVSTVVGHKAMWGLVELVANDHTALERATVAVRTAAEEHGIPLNGILVEEVVEDGQDLIISVTRDPLGDLLLVGCGGGGAEHGPPPSFAVLPIGAEELTELLREVGVAEELLDSAAEAVALTVGLFREERLSQLELNPVRVAASGRAWVLDALAYADQGKVE
jgi:acetate---CoA ligase (ADP-forming)